MAGNPIVDLLTIQQQIDALKARCTALEKQLADEAKVREQRRTDYARTIQELKTKIASLRGDRG